MAVLVAFLIACGCAFIGASAGAALYAVLFEILRPMDLDAAIDSEGMRDGARLAAAALGFAAGLWLARRWRPAAAPTAWRVLVVAALAGAGGAMLGYYADLGGLFIRVFGIGKDAYILMMLAGALACWLIGVALTLRHYLKPIPKGPFIGHALVACAGTFAILWVGLMIDKRAGAFDRNSPARTWFEVRFPAAVTMPLPKEGIRVYLRTDQGDESGFVTEWLNEGGRLLLRGSVDLKLRTRQRTLVLSLPDRPDLTFELRMPSNPRPSFGYGSWHRADGPAGAPDTGEFAIRYMVI